MSFYEDRLTGARNNMAKLEQKIERIQEAFKTGKNPYCYLDSDLDRAKGELRYYQSTIAALEAKIADIEAKARSRNIPAIISFLELWKDAVRSYRINQFEEYYQDKHIVVQALRDVEEVRYTEPEKYDEAHKEYKRFRHDCYATVIQDNKGCITRLPGKYHSIMLYVDGFTKEEAIERLEKELIKDAEAKYDIIVARACNHIKEITDATGLYVGGNGELNGVILGTEGKCSVTTISAGGYNIQCAHFRVLVRKIKEKTNS